VELDEPLEVAIGDRLRSLTAELGVEVAWFVA
jgi:hypothetical protein